MRRVRVAVCVLLTLGMFACSSSRGGKANPEDGGTGGDGNIPLATPGSEMPDVTFDFDSAALWQVLTLRMLVGLWTMLVQLFRLKATAMSMEANKYKNLALGERRARSAYDYLRSLGVKKDQMSTISYGEELPLDPSHDGRLRQRTDELTFL